MLALRDALASIWDFPTVRRNAVLDDLFDQFDTQKVAVVLREGELIHTARYAGEPPGFEIVHKAQVEWFTYGEPGDALEAEFDDGLGKIATAVEELQALIASGAPQAAVITHVEIADPPEYSSEPMGAKIVKSALLLVSLTYTSTRAF